MYVIAGVSGKTGSATAEALLEQKKSVRVILRNEDKAGPWRDKGAEVALTSLDDSAGLTRALSGAEGAYLLVPPDVKTTDYFARGRRFIAAYAEALQAARVPHVVLLSSIGAQHEKGNGPVAILHQAERGLSALSGVNVTFLRAAYFMENIGMVVSAARSQGVLPCAFDPDLRIPMIATADIGRSAAGALLEPPEHRQIIELEAAQRWSYADAAQILSKLLGRPVSAASMSEEGLVPALVQVGFSEHVAGLFREMYQGIDKGVLSFVGKDTRHLRGPTGLEAVLAKLV